MTDVDLPIPSRSSDPEAPAPSVARTSGGRRQPFQLRGASFTTMVLRLNEPVGPRFERSLAEKIDQAPGFYQGSPLVIDLDGLANGELTVADMSRLVTLLRQQGLVPVGIRAGREAHDQLAAATGLALFPTGRPNEPEALRGPPPPPLPTRAPTKVVTEPVRSGQQIYHGEGDIIVMAAVGSGAEVIAGGHVHVYGALRGRAIAGVAGDASARIWCSSLDAELVSVAGVYMISDRIDPALRHQRVQISANGDTLQFERLP